MHILGTIAVIAIGLIGYFVMAEALRDYSLFRFPRIIAALVAVLGCIGLHQAGERLAPALVIPFAALLLAVGAIWGITRLVDAKGAAGRPNAPPKEPTDPSTETLHNPWRTT